MGLFTIIFLAILSLTASLNVNEDKEYSSFFLKPDPNFDVSWFSQIPKWYVPMMSRTSLNRVARFFLTPEEIARTSENELAKKHCIVFGLGEKVGMLNAQGFGDREVDFPMNIDTVLPGRWDTTFPENPSGVFATSYAVLVDKKNGVLFVTQWMDGTKSFTLASPVGVKPSLTFIKKVEKILVKKYAFNPNFYVHSDYTKCDDLKNDFLDL